MCKITQCVKLHTVWNYIVCKSTHFRICENNTLFFKTAHFVQYQSSFSYVSIQKYYTRLICFTQPAVVMVVTNMKYVLVVVISTVSEWGQATSPNLILICNWTTTVRNTFAASYWKYTVRVNLVLFVSLHKNKSTSRWRDREVVRSSTSFQICTPEVFIEDYL